MNHFRMCSWAWCLAAAWMAIGLSAPASASPITWTLVGATFAGGGTATGSFVANVDMATISDWNVAISGLEVPSFDRSFNGTGIGDFMGDSVVLFDGSAALLLATNSPLDDLGGSRLLTGFYADSSNGVLFGANLASGALVNLPAPDVAPEPATWLLMGSGLLAMLGLGYRQRLGLAGSLPSPAASDGSF